MFFFLLLLKIIFQYIISHCAALLYISHFYVTRSALSFSFLPIISLFLSPFLFHFHLLSLTSLLISFVLIFFSLLLFSFLLSSHFSYWFFNCYISKLTSLSCLLGGSVYFEKVVITPATIASLHCLLWSGDSVQSLRVTQKGYLDGSGNICA